MATKQEILKDVCSHANRQVQALYPNLQLIFIHHNSGNFHEIVATQEHALAGHPAGRTAQTILEKHNNREQSGFIGMAIHHSVKWFGLASSDSLLALFNVNADEFNNVRDLRRSIYHFTWHAIDLMEVRKKKEYAAKFRSGPMIPKRSPMNLARLNLQADLFSSVMCALEGEQDAMGNLARQRSTDSVTPVQARRAEDYPFPIALEPAQFAYNALTAIKPSKEKFMHFAQRVALEVGRTFEDASIREWWAFSEPAQDMAWRNYPADHILGCAAFTCEDPLVRSTAHLVSDITGIAPEDVLKSGTSYNAFARNNQNQILHREIAEKTFEDAIARGVMEESGRPLITAANEQNENLTEGIILGWCANALQAAGRAFENALVTGISPAQAARMEFMGTKDIPTWDSLKKMGDDIIDQKRKGFGVTMGNIAEIGNSNPEFAPVLNSLRVTMKDPDYVRKLEAANDLATRPTIAPAGPAPKGPAPKEPAPAPAFIPAAPAPGLGGGGRTSIRNRTIMERQRRLPQDNQSGDNEITE